MLLPKGSFYAITFPLPPGVTAHPCMLNFRLTDKDGNEPQLDEGIRFLCRDSGNLLPLFTACAQLYKRAAPARLKAKTFELFDAIFPLSESDECCLAYINRHYTDRFSIPRLAQRCALSETAYRKRFKHLTGVSPVQYINRMKVEKACQMLSMDAMSPKDISEFLNFTSLPYFYKVFRDQTGITPQQYRNLTPPGSSQPDR